MSGAIDGALLARVADALIPGGDGRPPGGTVAFDGTLAVDPALTAVVGRALRALSAAGGPLPAAVARLAADDPAAHDALLLTVATAYYADPAVRAVVGYPGPAAIPLPALPDARDAVLAPLLARVRANGAGRYREIPPS